MRIVLGLIMLMLGIVFVIKTEGLYEFFGSVDFAEKYLGSSGGSRLFYKLLGILISVIGFMVVFNMHMVIMEWIGSTFFGAYTPPPAEEVKKALEAEY